MDMSMDATSPPGHLIRLPVAIQGIPKPQQKAGGAPPVGYRCRGQGFIGGKGKSTETMVSYTATLLLLNA